MLAVCQASAAYHTSPARRHCRRPKPKMRPITRAAGRAIIAVMAEVPLVWYSVMQSTGSYSALQSLDCRGVPVDPLSAELALTEAAAGGRLDRALPDRSGGRAQPPCALRRVVAPGSHRGSVAAL